MTGGQKNSVFSRYGLVRHILPRGCSTVLISKCYQGNDVTAVLSSTSPWFQLKTNRSIIFTQGIVFVEINALAMPLSITGLAVFKNDDDISVIAGSLSLNPNQGVLYGENRTHECLSFDITPRDIHDLLSVYIKTFMKTLDSILPGWLSFSDDGSRIIGLTDFHADLLRGRDIQNGMCGGAPLVDDNLYTVLQLGSSFNLSFYGEEITLPAPLNNEQFCFIIDICQDYGGSFYLILPEESRDLFDKFNFSRDLFKDYGIRIRPKGIGLSLFKHIDVLPISSELQLWNGDAVTTYQYAFFFICF